MRTHRNCPHCGTSEPIRVLWMPDTTFIGISLAVFGLGRAVAAAVEEFPQSAPWDVTIPDLEEVHVLSLRSAEPTGIDPSIHLAPDHQDYTPNHRKQRRGKFKRGGR